MKLIIGNKNYSSWSMRPWLVLQHFEIVFEEEMILLSGEGWKHNLLAKTPSGFVPVLLDEELVIDETIAIIEFLADKFPQHPIWPTDMKKRALARACAARMHAGFGALRNAAPMNLRASYPGRVPHALVNENLIELEKLLTPLLNASGGPFLFGAFCAADAMFAPIASRVRTYQLPVSKQLQSYFDAIFALPAFKVWQNDALEEKWIVDQDEIDNGEAAD